MNDCFMADTKPGLALFPGTEEEVQQRIERIKRNCLEKPDCLHVAKVGVNINETEAKYMEATRRLPRRVSMRLSK